MPIKLSPPALTWRWLHPLPFACPCSGGRVLECSPRVSHHELLLQQLSQFDPAAVGANIHVCIYKKDLWLPTDCFLGTTSRPHLPAEMDPPCGAAWCSHASQEYTLQKINTDFLTRAQHLEVQLVLAAGRKPPTWLQVVFSSSSGPGSSETLSSAQYFHRDSWS